MYTHADLAFVTILRGAALLRPKSEDHRNHTIRRSSHKSKFLTSFHPTHGPLTKPSAARGLCCLTRNRRTAVLVTPPLDTILGEPAMSTWDTLRLAFSCLLLIVFLTLLVVVTRQVWRTLPNNHWPTTAATIARDFGGSAGRGGTGIFSATTSMSATSRFPVVS